MAVTGKLDPCPEVGAVPEQWLARNVPMQHSGAIARTMDFSLPGRE